MTIRKGSWDVAGTLPEDDRSSAARPVGSYYSTYKPNSIANNSAGKLFLGSYSYVDGVENYNEGVSFNSRPTSVNGYYTYVQDGNDSAETGMINIIFLNGTEVVSTNQKALNATSKFTEFNIPIDYNGADLKVTSLKIMITSSNHASYNQSEETSNIKTTRRTEWDQNAYGAVLTIDNLSFTY